LSLSGRRNMYSSCSLFMSRLVISCNFRKPHKHFVFVNHGTCFLHSQFDHGLTCMASKVSCIFAPRITSCVWFVCYTSAKCNHSENVSSDESKKNKMWRLLISISTLLTSQNFSIAQPYTNTV
jgi:hypothetical protein